VFALVYTHLCDLIFKKREEKKRKNVTLKTRGSGFGKSKVANSCAALANDTQKDIHSGTNRKDE
jgi:hypothetical protein